MRLTRIRTHINTVSKNIARKQEKTYKQAHLSRTRANFFSERIVNGWNFLPDTVDFNLVPSPVLNAQSTRSIFLHFLSVLSCFYDMYLIFRTIAIFYVFVCYVFFSKATGEPGVSCSTSISLVRIAASLVFEQIT